MITETDLRAAIAECQGERNPNANTCIKLAAYYTILDAIQDKTPEYHQGYSGAVAPHRIDSESEFAQIVNSMDIGTVLDVMDELMDALSVVNRRLYDSVIRKLRDH